MGREDDPRVLVEHEQPVDDEKKTFTLSAGDHERVQLPLEVEEWEGP